MSSSYQPIALPGGIYAPIPTPFTEQEELNLDSLVKHALRLARAGVGLVISGSTGEAVALTNAERSLTIKSIRDALQKNGLTKTPIIAGTGTGSLKETITLSHEAKEAGADAVIVIAPGYFSSAIAKDRKALKEFFWCVVESSPQCGAFKISGADGIQFALRRLQGDSGGEFTACHDLQLPCSGEAIQGPSTYTRLAC